MNAPIRLILVALLGLGAAPAVQAQCIVTPGSFGNDCALGSPPAVRGAPRYLELPQPPPRPTFRAPEIPQPRQPQSLQRTTPAIPLSPRPAPGVALRCVTLYGACAIGGGAIPGGACNCGTNAGTAQ